MKSNQNRDVDLWCLLISEEWNTLIIWKNSNTNPLLGNAVNVCPLEKRHQCSSAGGTSHSLQIHRATLSSMYRWLHRTIISVHYIVPTVFSLNPQSSGKLQERSSLRFSALSFLPLYRYPNDLWWCHQPAKIRWNTITLKDAVAYRVT